MAHPATANGHVRPTAGGHATRRAIDDSRGQQETSLAQLIGESVALHLGAMLGELVQRVTAQPECFFCITSAAQAVRQYQLAVQNAQQAGEPLPPMPEPPSVNRSVTRVPVIQLAQGPAGPVPVGHTVPSCFECVQRQLGQEQAQKTGRVSVGLVDVAGNPLTFRHG